MRLYNCFNRPLDFCRRCFPGISDAWKQYGDPGGLTEQQQEGVRQLASEVEDGLENSYCYDTEHPEYDGSYTCNSCGRMLGVGDE